jgi:hypothetical protein
MQPGIGTNFRYRAKIFMSIGVCFEKLLKLIAGVNPALVTEFHAALLGANPDWASGTPYRGHGAFATQALNLLPRDISALHLPGNLGDFALRFGVISGISDIYFALAAKQPAPSLQGSMHTASSIGVVERYCL